SDGTGLIPPDEATTTLPGTDVTDPPSSSSTTPDAATLTWLAGADTDGGITVDTDAGQRWQSATPGEYAVIGDGWYRHFSPDGSLVGCTSTGSCVGVDGAGRVAVTAGPKADRLVYAPDGEFLGTYSADG